MDDLDGCKKPLREKREDDLTRSLRFAGTNKNEGRIQFHQRLVFATEIVACLGAGADVRANGDAPVELAAT